MSNTKPATKVTMYPVTASIWRHQTEKGDAYYNVSFERSYKNEAGEWQYTSTFGSGDLLLLAKVADKAHSEIYRLRASDRASQQIDE